MYILTELDITKIIAESTLVIKYTTSNYCTRAYSSKLRYKKRQNTQLTSKATII